MTKTDLKKLQNGSDIRGIALTGVPGELPNLTTDETIQLSRGYLLWLSKKTGKAPETLKIAVGRDPRLSGKMLRDGILLGMGPYGVKILDCGLASTPAMFMSTVFPEYRCDGAIMITASHLPYNRNGFKFFDKDGGLDKKDISQIIEYARSGADMLGAPQFTDREIRILGKKSFPSEQAELMDTYCQHLKALIKKGIQHPTDYDRPLSGLKIIVDAGNGSGGFYAKNILKPLGADIQGSQFLEPDGNFPNHPPNPENKEAMASISMGVLSAGADLGLIFDTDVDRSAAVDHRGREISRNGIVALAAALVAKDHPNTTVVTDSITSDHLHRFLEEDLNLQHFRFKRGYKNVINQAIELNRQGIDSQLAIETSGHAALKENYFLDDGAYLAAKIVIETARLHREGKTLDRLIAKLGHPEEATEIRLPIQCEDFASYGDQIISDLTDFVKKHENMQLETPNYEGIRVAFDGGWFLLRKSLHDPIMPLNIESDKIGGLLEPLDVLYGFLKQYQHLDLTSMERLRKQ